MADSSKERHLPQQLIDNKKNSQLAKIEVVPDKLQEDNLVLKKNGQQTVIPPAKMKELLSPTTNKGVTKLPAEVDSLNLLSIQSLGKNGIRSAKDVITFLKSPAGKEVEKLHHDMLADLLHMMEEKRQNQLHKHLVRLRFKGFLSLRAYYRKKARKKKELEAAYQKEIEALHAKSKKIAAETNLSDNDVSLYLMEQIYASYSLVAKMLEDSLTDTHQESVDLEKELELLEHEIQHMIRRYALYGSHLQLLDQTIDDLETEFAEKPVHERIQGIELRMTMLNNRIKDLVLQIKAHLQLNEHEQALQLLHELEGYNLQVMGLEGMLSALQNDKTYFDHEGNPTLSYKTANFILSSEQKLHRDKATGKLLLLNTNQNPDFMSQEEKNQAHANYKAVKPEISTFRVALKKNNDAEKAMYLERKANLLQQSDNMQKEILALTNHYHANQAILQNISSLRNNSQFALNPATIPTPAPTPKPARNLPAKPVKTTTQSYRDVLELMRFNPTPTAIHQFRDSLVHPDGRPNKVAQDAINKNLKPGVPLLPATMQNLLQRLEKLGVSSPNKPAYTSPSPFSTTPSPLKKPV